MRNEREGISLSLRPECDLGTHVTQIKLSEFLDSFKKEQNFTFRTSFRSIEMSDMLPLTTRWLHSISQKSKDLDFPPQSLEYVSKEFLFVLCVCVSVCEGIIQ